MGCTPIINTSLNDTFRNHRSHEEIIKELQAKQATLLQSINGEQEFYVKLFDFTAKAIAYKQFYVHIQFDNISFKSQIIENALSTTNLNINQQFAFKCSLSNLSCMQLKIILYARNDTAKDFTEECSHTISLWSLAVGPIYYDFSLFDYNRNRPVGRLSFCTIFSHCQTIQIGLENIQVNVFGEHQREELFVSLIVDVKGNALETTKVLVTSADYNSSNNQTTIKGQFSNSQLLTVMFPLSFINLLSSFLRVCLWKRKDIVEIKMASESSTALGSKFDDLIGIAHMPLTSIYFNDANILDFSSNKFRFPFEEKIYNEAHNTGIISGFLHCSRAKFLRQITFGVETENGFTSSSEALLSYKPSIYKGLPTEIKTIQSLRKVLTTECEKLFDAKLKKSISYFRIGEALNAIKEIINKHKGNNCLTSFFYGNIDELVQSQKVFISMGLKLLEYSRIDIFKYSSHTFELLSMLLWQKEFSLELMRYEPFIQNSHTRPSLLSVKNSVSENFQYMIYKALSYSLEGIVCKGPERNQKRFYSNFLAQALFIIPEFNRKFISIIQTGTISEFWPRYFELINQEQQKLGGVLFNWDEHFFKFVPDTPATEKSRAILLSCVDSGKHIWEEVIKKKRGAFLEIIANYMQYCHYYVKSTFYPWAIIPGYFTIVKEFINVMKNRSFQEYTDIFLDTCNTLLLNESLLNIMVYTIMSITRYNNYQCG